MRHWKELIDPDGPSGAYLPWKLVEPRVGISRTTAWRLQKAGDFPAPYIVSRGRVAYRESEVEAWKATRGHRGRPAPAAPGPAAAEAAPTGAAVPSPERPFAEPASNPPTRRRRARGMGPPPGQLTFDF